MAQTDLKHENMKKELLFTIMLVLGMMAAPVKVIGQTSNELPIGTQSAPLEVTAYLTGGTAGAKWRMYKVEDYSYGSPFYVYSIYFQSYYEGAGRYHLSVTNDWIETGNADGETFADYKSVIKKVDLTYYEDSDHKISAIGDNAFQDFTDLREVRLPSVVGFEIGKNAFKDCSKLTTVSGGIHYVTNIGESAFAGTRIYLTQNQKIGDLGDVTTLGTIGKSAFESCTNLSLLIIGKNIGTIGQYAFRGCSSLKELVIGDNVKTIAPYAFTGCTALTSISLGKSFSNAIMPSLIFTDPMNLDSITVSEENPTFLDEGNCLVDTTTNTLYMGTNSTVIPKDVETIYNKAFYGRTGLESIVIPASVTTINAQAFGGCTGLESIVIPASVTTIKAQAFDGCTNLKQVISKSVSPANLNNSSYVFRGISSDAVLYVPTPDAVASYRTNAWAAYFSDVKVGGTDANGITWKLTTEDNGANYTLTISGNGAMEDYSDMTTVPWSKNKIGEVVFNKITKVVVEEGVTHIGNLSLSNLGYYNSNDVEIQFDLPSTLLSIGKDAFANSYGLRSLEIPASVNEIGSSIHRNCINLSSITVAEGNTAYKAIDNCLLTADGQRLILGCKNSIIPDNVVTIYNAAFRGHSGLKEITLPRTLDAIGLYAFAGIANDAIVTCLAYELGLITPSSFTSGNSITLRVYNTANYSNYSGYFGKIEAIPVIITDGTVDIYESLFDGNDGKTVDQLQYNRTLLADSRWNALYVPFEIPMAEIADKYDVAYINDVRLYDSDNDGDIDENGMEVEVVYVKSGTLNANTPYLIRVKKSLAADATARNLALNLTDATLFPAVENTFDCSSVYKTFKFSGIYSRRMSEEIPGAYAIAGDGNWHTISDGSWLNPFRIFLTIENRDGTPYQSISSAAIRNRVAGEEDGTTGINDTQLAQDKQQTVYDLQGRPVENPTKGIYIVNGKKTLIK